MHDTLLLTLIVCIVLPYSLNCAYFDKNQDETQLQLSVQTISNTALGVKSIVYFDTQYDRRSCNGSFYRSCEFPAIYMIQRQTLMTK